MHVAPLELRDGAVVKTYCGKSPNDLPSLRTVIRERINVGSWLVACEACAAGLCNSQAVQVVEGGGN